MALTYTPTTELQAVNAMLRSIGEAPVNTLPTAGVSDASLAQDTLHEVNRAVQGKGLKFNSDYQVRFTPDVDGYINIPTNALRVTATFRSYDTDYAVRNRKLYDRRNQTYVFTSFVELDITYFLTWADMPEHVRRYVYVRASRQFQQETVGSQILWQFKAQDEAEARAEMNRWEIIKRDQTLLESPGIFRTVKRRI
jgi:hypothetical protein